MSERKEETFTVRDRRISAADGAVKEQTQKGAVHEIKEDKGGKETAQQKPAPLPAPDFSSFILSLAASAQVSLGIVPNPETNLTARNLPAAKHMIDTIAMLKEKTNGNLTADETSLIEDVLYSLRMLYIKSLEDGL